MELLMDSLLQVLSCTMIFANKNKNNIGFGLDNPDNRNPKIDGG